MSEKDIILRVCHVCDAPLPNDNDPNYSWGEARRTVLNAYDGFDSKMAEIAEQFFENKCEEKAGFRQNINEVYSEFKRYNQENDYNKKINKSSFLTQMQRFMGKPRCVGKEKYFIDFTIVDGGEEY